MRWLIVHLSRLLSAFYYRLQLAPAPVYVRVRGQGLVEYGLVLVLIMVVCVAILGMTGQTISEVWYTKLLPAFN
jgi:hypothetical protein